MRFAWSHTVSIDSPLTPDQVCERLRECFETYTERRRGFWDWKPVPNVLRIWLSDEGFHTEYPRSGTGKGTPAKVHGRLHALPSGTRIDLALCLSETDQWTVSVFVGILVMMTTLVLGHEGMSGIGFAAFPLGFALLMWSLVTTTYMRAGRKIIKALEGVLDASSGQFVERRS